MNYILIWRAVQKYELLVWLAAILFMKDLTLTNDSSARTVSDIITAWLVQLKDHHIRFVRAHQKLTVEILSIIDFKYYLDPNQPQPPKAPFVPKSVADKLGCKYNDFSFHKGKLSMELPSEFSRFQSKYTFPPFQQLELHEELFLEMAEMKSRDLELKCVKRQLEQLQKEKLIIIDEMRSRNRDWVEKVQAEEQEGWKERLAQWCRNRWQSSKALPWLRLQWVKVRREPDCIFTFMLLVILVVVLSDLFH